MLTTPRSSVSRAFTPLRSLDLPVCSASPAPTVSPSVALGFSAFAERNQPRYACYAKARLAADPRASAVVRATLAFARQHWIWLLSQPSPAGDVWEELRYQVRRQTEEVPSSDMRTRYDGLPESEVSALYDGLPETSADSALLCCRLGLAVGEAAELMGLEPPAVAAGLVVARRNLPRLVEGSRP